MKFQKYNIPIENGTTKGVFFDMDDTLYLRSQPFVRTCEEVLEPLFHLDWSELYKRRNHYGEIVFGPSQRGEISMEEMYVYRLSNAVKEFGKEVARETVLLFEERYQYNQTHIEVQAEMKELLDLLMEHKIPMGIITNGPSEHQRKKLEALRIEQWIPKELWIISGECGVTKPDKRIFQIAEERMGIPSEHLMYIGDHYENDLVGARKAGWRADFIVSYDE